MTLLIAGVLLWWASHLVKRVAPGLRAGLGENPGKAVVAVVSVIAVVLMVMGYRRADIVPVYAPLAGMGHLNNLLMLIALLLFAVAQSKGALKARLRHPMLLSVVVWAVAHLLVNGDVASLILFGGLGAWAVVSILMINAQSDWVRPVPGPASRDIVTVVIALVMYAIFAGVHIWLGHNPFMGTYG
jgi:uncharacterized membrane protein